MSVRHLYDLATTLIASTSDITSVTSTVLTLASDTATTT